MDEIDHDLLQELSGLLFDEKVSFIDKQAAIEVGQVGMGRLKPILKWCSPTLKNDRDFVLYIVSRNRDNLGEAKDEFRDNAEIVWSALKANPNALQYASKRLQDNSEIVEYTLNLAYRQIPYVSDCFKKDQELMFKMLKKDCEAWQYIDQDLKNDIKFLKKAWNHINDEFYTGQLSNYHLWFFIEHLEGRVKRFFENVESDREVSLKQMDDAFERFQEYLDLPKELENELNSVNRTQPKKLKL